MTVSRREFLTPSRSGGPAGRDVRDPRSRRMSLSAPFRAPAGPLPRDRHQPRPACAHFRRQDERQAWTARRRREPARRRGTIGAAAAAKAPADGYTILWAAGSLFACNPFLYKNLQYAFEDFTPIGCFSDSSFVLFVRRGLGVKTLAAAAGQDARRTRRRPLRQWRHRQPVAPDLGAAAAAGEGGRLNVPFQTGGTLQALLGDTVDVGCSLLDPGLIQYFSSGDFVPLAMTSPTRRPQLPDVPTFIECGFAGFTASGGYAALVPRGTPDAVVAKLRTDFDAVTSDPAIIAKLDQLAAEVPQWRRADDYKTWFAGDRELWRKIIAETGITLG